MIGASDKIYDKLIDALQRKQKHLESYSEIMDILARTNSSTAFYISGNCEKCNALDSEIKHLCNQMIDMLN